MTNLSQELRLIADGRDPGRSSIYVLTDAANIIDDLAACLEPHARHPEAVQVIAGKGGAFWGLLARMVRP